MKNADLIKQIIIKQFEDLRNNDIFQVKMEIEPILILVDPLIANFPFENLHVFKPLIENEQRSHFREPNYRSKIILFDYKPVV